MNKFTPSLFALGAIMLIGAGCASAPTATETPTKESPVTQSAPTPVPLSQLTKNILDAQDDYHSFIFTEVSGNCSEQGLPSKFEYAEDPTLGYFITLDPEGTFKDEITAATTSAVMFDQVTVGGQSAACVARLPWQKDGADVECSKDEQKLCTGVYNVVALPR